MNLPPPIKTLPFGKTLEIVPVRSFESPEYIKTLNRELFQQKREEKIPSEISLTWDLSTIQFLTLGQETALLVGTTSSN